MIILDTSVLSMIFRRTETAPSHPVISVFRRLIEDDVSLGVPGAVHQELLSGVRSQHAFQALEDALSGFTLLLADKPTHRLAAQIHATCRASGVSAASFDALIAAHTIVVGGELLTLDADFRHMAPLISLRLTPIETVGEL